MLKAAWVCEPQLEAASTRKPTSMRRHRFIEKIQNKTEDAIEGRRKRLILILISKGSRVNAWAGARGVVFARFEF